MSRLDGDIYEVYESINEAKQALVGLEMSDDNEDVRSQVETALEDIERKLNSIEADADLWEDEQEVDTDNIERYLSNIEDAISEYISDIRGELP